MTPIASDVLSEIDVDAFHRDGFLVRRGFLSAEQVAALVGTLERDAALHERAMPRLDGDGGAVELSVWNEPGDDSFGALARSDRLVGAVTQLLGDEVYHYHSKLNSKRPRSAGMWVWHQDYGYWYENGCLTPDMLTVAVPLSPMSRDNGCLELLRGSHRCGRVDHARVGDQHGADPERVAEIEARFEKVAFESEPGDVMFFHCNVLHTSAGNDTDRSRELLLVAYNTKSNDPTRPHHHAAYTPIDVLPDSDIMARSGVVMGERRTFVPRRSAR
ncbi:phytanoyl-CoA dioxygenase family protein [Desertimonas flava]|uniref:phytanoyl-CoA dioxygenase family protein n=1 Tax=Desertimonas flava TaxID=2064846 RepID=UPI000E348AF6|nr:phytanoyl-CoA dioxygenase family protein [Desertimonas flava]